MYDILAPASSDVPAGFAMPAKRPGWTASHCPVLMGVVSGQPVIPDPAETEVGVKVAADGHEADALETIRFQSCPGGVGFKFRERQVEGLPFLRRLEAGAKGLPG